jgi:hypothetical protein
VVNPFFGVGASILILPTGVGDLDRFKDCQSETEMSEN